MVFRKKRREKTDRYVKDVKNVNGIVIISLAGNFNIESTPNICRSIGDRAVEPCPKAVLLDFSDVVDIDSAAFACLLGLIKEKIKDPAKIGIFNFTASHRSLAEILRVHKIINHFRSQEEALKFFTSKYDGSTPGKCI